MAKSIMCVGTASHVGKSVLCTALCRILAQDGFAVAPFKSQNMSLNSAVTPSGLEIGRAQAVQAAACRIPPSEHMNPVLLKPTGDSRSQIVLQGRVHGTQSARAYFRERRSEIWDAVVESHAFLDARHDILVIEGAGSPVEMNLKARDIANMRVAELADAAVLLVADISRGGIFASVLGTMHLFDAAERARVKGVVVNQFRGDPALFADGVSLLEMYAGVPVFGVIPYVADIGVEEEDSVVLDEDRYRQCARSGAAVRIAVVRLPHLSNFTDFDALYAEDGVEIAYCRDPEQIRDAHVVILPGTKSTISDLFWLRDRGWEEAIRTALRSGARVFGICGGFQMLGTEVLDPDGVESELLACVGLGLLPVSTVMSAEKSTILAEGTLAGQFAGIGVSGYEIHMGISRPLADIQPFARLSQVEGEAPGGARPDGAVSSDGMVAGTYLHGIFDNDVFRAAWLSDIRGRWGLPPGTAGARMSMLREMAYDRLADVVRRNLRMDLVYGALGVAAQNG